MGETAIVEITIRPTTYRVGDPGITELVLRRVGHHALVTRLVFDDDTDGVMHDECHSGKGCASLTGHRWTGLQRERAADERCLKRFTTSRPVVWSQNAPLLTVPAYKDDYTGDPGQGEFLNRLGEGVLSRSMGRDRERGAPNDCPSWL